MSPSNPMEPATVFSILVMVTSTSIITGSSDHVTVRTTHGDVRGRMMSVLGRQVQVYWGIPYAKIPARFQRAETAEAWEGVLEAVTPPPSCPEVPYTMDVLLIPQPSTAFEENCLYLNLWVPQGCADKADEEGLAVMVWIHGGALQFGSSTVPTYDGQVLAATQCVIVASMNYRLGVLGFLSLGTTSAPGNVGLVDQALALEWIHHNAAHFGGSPHRVTIFGESAGAMSVGAHMASPLSQHYFSRAIIQSGPPTRPFGKSTSSQNAASARKLAELTGCPFDDEDAMITCLSEADASELGRVASDMKHFSLPAFGVIVDDYFLKKPLTDSFFSGEAKKTEVMIGITADDGSFLLPLFTASTMKETSRPLMNYTRFLMTLKNHVFPSILETPKRQNLLVKLLEHIYVTSALPNQRDDYHTAIEKMLGDLIFVCPMYSTVAHLRGTKDAYMYSFEHRSSISPFPEWMGVVHASEIDFVFGRPLDQGHVFTEEERQLSLLMMTAWANFAKFGNPNSDDAPTQWPPLNNASFAYAAFGSPSHVSIKLGLRYRECVFWNDAYTELVNKPSAPVPMHRERHDEF